MIPLDSVYTELVESQTCWLTIKSPATTVIEEFTTIVLSVGTDDISTESAVQASICAFVPIITFCPSVSQSDPYPWSTWSLAVNTIEVPVTPVLTVPNTPCP
jgi:hypothetical protein